MGEGVTTVFDGILTISSTATTVPLPFDVVIDVADTFSYDPSRGDLLVDFFVRDSNYPFAQFFETPPDYSSDFGTQRIYSTWLESPTGTVGYVGDSYYAYGLVTQIGFDTPPDPADWYSFDVSAGDTVTIALELLAGAEAQFALVAPDGKTLALSSAGQADNIDQLISNFVVTTSGTYALKVTSDTGATYNLVVTRNTAFDEEVNDDTSTAQPLSGPEVAGRRWAMGAISSSSSRLFATVASLGQIVELDAQTGAIVNQFAPPVPIGGRSRWPCFRRHEPVLFSQARAWTLWELDPETGEP